MTETTRTFEVQADGGERYLVIETRPAPRYELKDGREVVPAGEGLFRIKATGEILTPLTRPG